MKQGWKPHQKLAFLPFNKACTNKFYIFPDNVHILSICPDTIKFSICDNGNMNAFDLFMVYLPECKQQLRTMK